MKKDSERTEYSVIIPVFNEQENIPEAYRRLTEVFKDITYDYEFIFVNDGSTDGSLGEIKLLSEQDIKVKYLDFSRNFGHQIAITAGMDFSSGDSVIIIDADLQDPPELIPRLIEERKKGFDVVYAIRHKRKGESFLKKLTAALFYRVFSRVTNINIPLDVGDFRLIDRKVLDSLKTIREKSRFIRGLVSWVGYKQTGISYDREKRMTGRTKYHFLKMLRFSMDGITSFSTLPLKIATILGCLISCFSFFIGVYFIFVKLFTNKLIQGWITLLDSILFLGGIQLIFLGIIGEYIGRIYEEVKNRPLYLIKEKRGF